MTRVMAIVTVTVRWGQAIPHDTEYVLPRVCLTVTILLAM